MRWLQRYLFITGMLLTASAGAACVVTDDAGQRISLSQPARRILVLAPDLVENIFAIDAGRYVIGVIGGSDYPLAARRIAKVGSYGGIDLERIVTLQPDLIVTWKYAFPRQLAALKQFGIPVYVSAPKKLEDVPRLMRQLGCLTAQEKSAATAASKFEDDIKMLRSQFAGQKAVKVFFQIDRNALLTVNRDSWIHQVLELCGGRNIFAAAKTLTPEVSREAIITENPDVIMNDASNHHWQQSWQVWPEMKAVKQHHLYTVNPDWIARAGPRLVSGARQVCDYLKAARTA